ncbi:unnamed protein product, partial [Rangifer tarandus platyrhynchus]
METRVALMEETRDERTRPGEGKAISIITPRSSLHPSPDCMEVQHPDPASGKDLQSANQPPARGATGPHTPAYHSLSSAVSDRQSALPQPTLLPPVLLFTV